MSDSIEDHLSELRDILLALEATGERGFEGLIGAALSEIAGQPFRLASSGSQQGRDGESSLDSGAIYFEAKLYRGRLQKDSVLSRITEAGIGTAGHNVDVWVLASTQEVSAQHRELFRLAAERLGMGLLLLDWSHLSLPPLAVALAAGSEGTCDFFARQPDAGSRAQEVTKILEAIAKHRRYRDHADKLRANVCSPAIGVGLAAAKSRGWLENLFSSRRQAIADLGQPLAPADRSLLHTVGRPGLLAAVRGGFETQGVLSVLGGEGCGKSWLLAQAWLSIEPRPLFVLITSDELSGAPSTHRFESVLRNRLVQQASERDVEAATMRWRRRFDQWRAAPSPVSPRLVVAVDGLNQAPKTDWPRWVAAASIVLEKLGGSLVLTSRRHFFDHFVRDNLICPFVEVEVPPWSISEVRKVLEANSVDPTKVDDRVCASLRNPRLLGLAIGLLNASEVEQLTELSDDRLLFEYMRRYATIGRSGVTAAQFAQILRTHATEIIERLTSTARGHPSLDTSGLEDDLGAVAQSQFFRPLAGDPTGYELVAEALPLALGLSIVHALRIEEAAGRDPAEALDTIVEPILSLDRTADVIGAAVIVASLDKETSARVTATLIRSYVGLQNLPHEDRDAFLALSREAPGAFVEAAREVCTSSDRVPNFDWIVAALSRACEDERAWPTISEGVREWISTHSMSPELRARKRRGHHRDEEVDEELLEKTRELEQKVNDLSLPEVEVLRQLRRADELSLDRLHGLALSLLAGKPLAEFSNSLLRWAFSNALNSGLSAPSEAFRHLIRFNTSDWAATREALTAAASVFKGAETSRVGQWALVAVLQATGGSRDAAQAAEMVAELTRDYPAFPPWRLVETYCANDPCDPGSEEPENISETAARYLETDVSKLHIAMAQTSEDMFFRMARPGLARFRRDVAVTMHRAFCDDVGSREGLPRRQGAWGVLKHSVLLQDDSIQALVESALRDYTGDEARDEWVTSQNLLRAAFPHLDGDTQLHVLAQLDGRSLLLDLMESTAAASVEAVDQYLRPVLKGADEDARLRILAFLHYSGSAVQGDLAKGLVPLMESSDSMTRAHVLGIIAGTDDEALLMAAVRHWRVGNQDSDLNQRELWFGSAALVRAAALGFVDPAELIDQISPLYYGSLLRQLGARGAELIAPRFDAAIRKATGSPDPPPTLRMACNVILEEQRGLAAFDVSEDVAEPADLRAGLERMSESPEAFRERQERVHKKFHEYWGSLSTEGGRLVLEAMSFEEIRDLLDAEPSYLTEWLELLRGLDHSALGKVHWLGTLVAEVAAATHPTEVAQLIRRLDDSKGVVHFSFGIGAVSAEPVSVWRVALRVPAVRDMCFHRLDRVKNDEEIAEEVLSACVAGADDLVRAYVDERLASEEPVWIARALTVSGFCGECAHSDGTLLAFENASGFLGGAGKAARYAYDRNRWATHWFRQMVEATTPEDLWRYAVLLNKIIDARCELWWSYPPGQGELLQRFAPTLRQDLQRRIKKWRDTRRETLFGQKVPDSAFLHGMRRTT